MRAILCNALPVEARAWYDGGRAGKWFVVSNVRLTEFHLLQVVRKIAHPYFCVCV
jgi:hypothetical protein